MQVQAFHFLPLCRKKERGRLIPQVLSGLTKPFLVPEEDPGSDNFFIAELRVMEPFIH